MKTTWESLFLEMFFLRQSLQWWCLLEFNFVKEGLNHVSWPELIFHSRSDLITILMIFYLTRVISRTIWLFCRTRTWLTWNNPDPDISIVRTEHCCSDWSLWDYHKVVFCQICPHRVLASTCRVPVMYVPLFRYFTEQQGFLSRTFSKWFGY